VRKTMRKERTYKRIWVKAAPSDDPELQGKEVVRMPWQSDRQFTFKPVEQEKTPAVIRMLHLGDIVELKPAAARKELAEIEKKAEAEAKETAEAETKEKAETKAKE